MKRSYIVSGVAVVLLCNCLISSATQIRLPAGEEDSLYYQYKELEIIFTKLQENYSEIFSFESIGKTYHERDIWLVKISDNVLVNETEPELFFTGGIHGNEKSSTNVVMFSIMSLVENYTTLTVNKSFTEYVKNIVNNTELYFIPIVNPDGYVANNRKNLRPNRCIFGRTFFRGVDLNRNFDYKREELKNYFFKNLLLGSRRTVLLPALDFSSIIKSGRYWGPYAFSEKETQAIKKFVEDHEISMGIDYHTYAKILGYDFPSQTRKIFYPWGWTEESPDDEQLLKSIATNISKINDYDVLQMSYWQYVFGFFSDWMYGEHDIIHYTIELDIISNTPLNTTCESHLLVNLYLAEIMLT